MLNPSSATPGVPGSQRLNRLWIGGLPRNVSVDDVRDEVNRIYSAYGPVADVCVITTARDVMCFVQYEDEQVAYRAREDTNGKTILGSLIKVNYAVVRGPDSGRPAPFRAGQPTTKSPEKEEVRDPNRRMIVVANIPSDMTSQELGEIATSVAGDVAFANVWGDEDTTYGLVTFDETRDARRAKRRLNGATLEGSRRKLETLSFEEYNVEMKKKRSRSVSRDRRRR